jgi:flavodoxin
MKVLVVYYSRSGNTKFVAEEVASNLNSDIKELIDKKKRSGIWGYFWAGHDALMNKKTEIEELDLDLAQYELIFLGCPNWAANIPPAVRTFLDRVDLKNKKLVFFCTQDSMGADRVFNNLRLLAKGAEILDQEYFDRVGKNKEGVKAQIKEWLKKFKQ